MEIYNKLIDNEKRLKESIPKFDHSSPANLILIRDRKDEGKSVDYSINSKDNIEYDRIKYLINRIRTNFSSNID